MLELQTQKPVLKADSGRLTSLALHLVSRAVAFTNRDTVRNSKTYLSQTLLGHCEQQHFLLQVAN